MAPKLAVAEMLLRTLDGKAFLVEKVANPLQQRHIVRPVITTAATALQRTKRTEFRLPEAENVRRDIKMLGYLGNRAERI